MRINKYLSVKKFKGFIYDTLGRSLDEYVTVTFTNPQSCAIFTVDNDTVSVRLSKETLEKLGKAMLKLAKGIK